MITRPIFGRLDRFRWQHSIFPRVRCVDFTKQLCDAQISEAELRRRAFLVISLHFVFRKESEHVSRMDVLVSHLVEVNEMNGLKKHLASGIIHTEPANQAVLKKSAREKVQRSVIM